MSKALIISIHGAGADKSRAEVEAWVRKAVEK